MSSLADLGALDWTLLAAAAVLVGVAKTSVGGIAAVSVAVFAAVLPARESTGVLLVLLIVGDLFAVRAYRAHTDWRVLARLVPSVAVGILVGALFVARIDDATMRRTIGAVLLGLVMVHVVRARRSGPRAPSSGAGHHVLAATFGLLAGFTTMVANAGGAVMALYLLSSGLPMLAFLGTGAVFFFVVNVVKVPFSVALGLITLPGLLLDAVLVPAVVVGAVLGRLVITRLDQRRFEAIVLVVTALSALNLLR